MSPGPRSLALALACMAAVSCSSPGPLAPVASSTTPRAVSDVGAGELIGYLARLRGLGERGVAAEVVRQRQRVRAHGSDLEALKLALALSAVPAGDEAEILATVEPLARKPAADEEVRAVAGFLLLQMSERRRLKEGAAATGSRLRDERRAAEAQKQRADALQERAAQLQQTIQALSELEKTLSDRTLGR